ncbi:MAG: AAA family ATPase [Intrasporangiaceae bacterium]|nr:AAA family ATPase [Intrasporangiaceae bacterium]
MQLVVIFGPPAVGKMTVGRALAGRSGFRLFHNHALIEPLLEVFDYGTPPFNRLLESTRQRVVEEAAQVGQDLILTYVWGLESQADADELTRQITAYVDRGATVSFVELTADLDSRLARNRTPLRLAEKRSKRDIEWSDANVREMERFVMNTQDRSRGTDLPGLALLQAHRHLHIDNTELSADETAELILRWLGGDDGPDA